MAIPLEELLKEDFDFPINEANLDQFRQVQNILPLLGAQRGAYGLGIGSGGTNLAGGYMPSYSIATDPTYSSGFQYAQSISGGMPMSQVIAPGVSYSPDVPGGYTQADLNVVDLPRDVAPVFSEAPTTGEVFEPSYPTMPDAPTGTPMPEPLPNFFGRFPIFDPSQNTFAGEDFQIYKPPFELPTQEAQDFVALPEGYSYTPPEGRMYSSVMPRQGMRYAYGPNGERIEVTDNRKDFADFSITDESPAFTFQDGGFVPVSQPIIQPIEDIRSTFTPEIIAEQLKEQQEKEEREMQNIERKFGNIENLQERISNIMSSAPPPAPVPVAAQNPFVTNLPTNQPVITSLPSINPPVIPSLLATPSIPRPSLQIDEIVKPIITGSGRFNIPSNRFSLM